MPNIAFGCIHHYSNFHSPQIHKEDIHGAKNLPCGCFKVHVSTGSHVPRSLGILVGRCISPFKVLYSLLIPHYTHRQVRERKWGNLDFLGWCTCPLLEWTSSARFNIYIWKPTAVAQGESSFTSNKSSEESKRCISTKLSIFQGCRYHFRVTRVLSVFWSKVLPPSSCFLREGRILGKSWSPLNTRKIATTVSCWILLSPPPSRSLSLFSFNLTR